MLHGHNNTNTFQHKKQKKKQKRKRKRKRMSEAIPGGDEKWDHTYKAANPQQAKP